MFSFILLTKPGRAKNQTCSSKLGRIDSTPVDSVVAVFVNFLGFQLSMHFTQNSIYNIFSLFFRERRCFFPISFVFDAAAIPICGRRNQRTI